ncbi:MAG: phosphate signaling complex protein PhoU [Acidobacteriota bacterium]|nr:phosphate signaling complex protein PhoU [Acidobacteriota bacterium]
MDAPKKLTPHFQDELSHLKERLLVMAGTAEEQVRASVQSLVDRDRSLAECVLVRDEPINQLHIEIDELCFQLLALHQPMATDLREVVSGVKINSDLERVGDFAINIAEASLRYLEHPAVKPLIDIPRMAEIAQGMLRDSLDAYVRQDTTRAQDVLDRDDSVDRLKDQVFRDLIGCMCTDSMITQPAMELMLISRHLERIADHATNIAEEAIFIVSGLDVRHHSREGGTPSI